MSKVTSLEDRRMVLIQQINDIDEMKRDIRQQLSDANMKDREGTAVLDREWVHKAKYKVNRLTVERTECTVAVAKLKKEIADGNRKTLSGNQEEESGDIAREFLEVAEDVLTEEQFDEIYDKAISRQWRL